MLSDIRKLKAALAAPLDFGDADNDGDNASEVSAAKAPAKVTNYIFHRIEAGPGPFNIIFISICGVQSF